MKKLKTILHSEGSLYIIFGLLTTLLSISIRNLLFLVYKDATVTTVISDIVGILFAFFTNDRWVFRQERHGWLNRLFVFTLARLSTLVLNALLSWIFVDTYPGIIGQFVNHQIATVNLIETLIAQVLIIVLNYILSKWFVFTDKK